MEDAARAVTFGVVGEFGAESAVGLDFPPDEAVEAEERDGGDFAARIERTADDARIGVLEDARHVLRLADFGVSVVEFVADFEQFDLSPDFVANEVVDVVQALDTFHLDAGTLRDGDVHVLSNGAETALDVAGRA